MRNALCCHIFGPKTSERNNELMLQVKKCPWLDLNPAPFSRVRSSSLQNIIFKSFSLVLILWRLLKTKELSICDVFSLFLKEKICSISTRTFLNNDDVGKKKKDRCKSLHNTRTSQKELKLILWKLLILTPRLYWLPNSNLVLCLKRPFIQKNH